MSGHTLTTLGALPIWVAWRNETRKGKLTKVPLNPKGDGQWAKADDSRTWAIRHQAEMAAPRLVNGLGGGIGIELADIGDGLHLGGIDLDTCVDAQTGLIDEWARQIIISIPTYWEISPSKTGVKGYFLYRVSDREALRAAMGTQHGRQWQNGGGEHPPAIELHIGNRYFAVTNEHLSETPKTIETVSVDKLLRLIREAGPAFKGGNAAAGNAPEGGGDDDGMLARLNAAAARNPSLGRVLGKMAAYGSRSAAAMALGAAVKAAGWSFEDMAAALGAHPETAEWAREKGEENGRREIKRIWNNAANKGADKAPEEPWGEPDMSVLKPNRRSPPPLPLDVFGVEWANWIEGAADAAAAPVDYVALPLLASASALIGHARWAEAVPGWREPPHLWLGVVGDSGSSKSPGADCLMRDVLPEIERRMLGDFPDRLKEWRAAAEIQKAKLAAWEKDVKAAHKGGSPPPMPPVDASGPEPQAPRLRQSDVTIERVASLLATAAPKGLLLVRDELAGWLLGQNAYNESGRAFWLEAYGGRPYRVERQKHPEPIMVARLAVAVTGGTQPERLAEMFRDADDGLMARIAWAWPDPKPFRISGTAPNADFAILALDKLRALELMPESGDKPGMPVYVPLEDTALTMMEAFGRDMQEKQQSAGGLMCSAYGKARGLALRLSLVLGFLDWAAAATGYEAPPSKIGEAVLSRACDLVADYFLPMAERVYGDAAASAAERNATTLARWIMKERPIEVHVRRLQREVRLPGLGDAKAIHAAAGALVDAEWLQPPEAGEFQARARAAYPVNPAVLALPR
jgi:hypothetical protein